MWALRDNKQGRNYRDLPIHFAQPFYKRKLKRKEENTISYLVCHMEKLHKTDISPVEKENERDENYKADNPQIDSSKTRNNYSVIHRGTSYTECINQRIKELNLPSKIRKDAVLLNSFVIGSDKAFFEGMSMGEQKQFFRDCVKYFSDTYGEENIVSAVVHMDETTPHLHLNLIPITSNGRLCSKDLFDKNKLSELQTNFHIAVGLDYGLERGKEGSQRKHLSTVEYKAQRIKIQALAEKAELDRANELAKAHFDDTQKKTASIKAERDKLVMDREKETDYAKALQEAKDGIAARDKHKLKDQVVALKMENGKLQKENERLQADNADLFKSFQGKEDMSEKHKKALMVIKSFREHEPDAFARTFYRVGGILQAFIPQGEPPTRHSRNRLEEIQREIEEEKRKEQKNNHSNHYNDGK